MPPAGGPSGKADNRYEARWTVACMAPILSGKCYSIRLEPPGLEGQGVEFCDGRSDLRCYHQAGRQHGEKLDAKIQSVVIVSEGEKKRLIAKCGDAELRFILAPFLGKGHFKLSDYMHGSRRYDTPLPVPVSYGDLPELGALNPTADGLKMLHKIATAPVDTIRTRWLDYRKRLQDDHALRDLVLKGQQLLIELGLTIVELGMLSL